MQTVSGIPAIARTEEAIRAILNRQTEAWNKGNPEQFLETLTDDATFTHILGETHFGKHPLLEAMDQILRTAFEGSTLQFKLRNLKVIRPDIAVVDIDSELRGYQGLPPGVTASKGVLRTALLQVMIREAEQWRVVAFHNVDRKDRQG